MRIVAAVCISVFFEKGKKMVCAATSAADAYIASLEEDEKIRDMFWDEYSLCDKNIIDAMIKLLEHACTQAEMGYTLGFLEEKLQEFRDHEEDAELDYTCNYTSENPFLDY